MIATFGLFGREYLAYLVNGSKHEDAFLDMLTHGLFHRHRLRRRHAPFRLRSGCNTLAHQWCVLCFCTLNPQCAMSTCLIRQCCIQLLVMQVTWNIYQLGQEVLSGFTNIWYLNLVLLMFDRCNKLDKGFISFDHLCQFSCFLSFWRQIVQGYELELGKAGTESSKCWNE